MAFALQRQRMSHQAFATQTDLADNLDECVGCGQGRVDRRAAAGIDGLQYVRVATVLEPIDDAGMSGDRTAL